jgi:hypothetical protein
MNHFLSRYGIWLGFALVLFAVTLGIHQQFIANHVVRKWALPSSLVCPTTCCWGKAACSALAMRSTAAWAAMSPSML